jgi:MarR family transcriptional regulator, lower aerobic nicotinate degradation pathway regulator
VRQYAARAVFGKVFFQTKKSKKRTKTRLFCGYYFQKMDIDFLKKIIDEVHQFSVLQKNAPDVAAFATWLQQRQVAVARQPEAPATTGETTESKIGKLLVFLNRYAKSYTKKLLDSSPLTSADDFVFLIYLLHRGAATKTELIEAARLEKPTGMEVIRRLLGLGMVEQSVHESDRRSKTITLTPLGQATLMSVLGRFDQLSVLLTANLAPEEKMELLRLLQKLEDFHQPLRTEQRHASWDELLTHSGLTSG